MRICFYVSGHGLGHASRALQVMDALPASTEVIIKSIAPEWFFRENLHRAFKLLPQQFDVGACQKNNREIDWESTIRECERVSKQALMRSKEEVLWLREARIDAVVVDVAPMPLRLAHLAGIPGIAVVNFTWADILANRARTDPRARRLRKQYLDDYRHAALALRTPMSLKMAHFPRVSDIPLIARRGKRMRSELAREIGATRGQRIVLLYFGTWPDHSDYSRLARMKSVRFVSMLPMGGTVVTLDKKKWHFPDVVASCDGVVAKPGYGTLGECLANSTPVLYYPRPEFAEYPALRRAVDQWGGAVRIPSKDFRKMRWERALQTAFELSPDPVDSSGAHVAATAILNLARQERASSTRHLR